MKKYRAGAAIVSPVALNVVIAVLAMLWLVPVFWLVVSSFRAEQGAYTLLPLAEKLHLRQLRPTVYRQEAV